MIIDLTSDDEGPNQQSPAATIPWLDIRVPRPAFESPRKAQLSSAGRKSDNLAPPKIREGPEDGFESDSSVEIVSTTWKPIQRQRIDESITSDTVATQPNYIAFPASQSRQSGAMNVHVATDIAPLTSDLSGPANSTFLQQPKPRTQSIVQQRKELDIAAKEELNHDSSSTTSYDRKPSSLADLLKHSTALAMSKRKASKNASIDPQLPAKRQRIDNGIALTLSNPSSTLNAPAPLQAAGEIAGKHGPSFKQSSFHSGLSMEHEHDIAPKSAVHRRSLPQYERRGPSVPSAPVHTSKVSRIPYSKEEDALLGKMRSEGHHWDEIVNHFPGRTKGSLQVHWSTKIQHKPGQVKPSTTPSYLKNDLKLDTSSDDAEGTKIPRRRLQRRSTLASHDTVASSEDASAAVSAPRIKYRSFRSMARNEIKEDSEVAHTPDETVLDDAAANVVHPSCPTFSALRLQRHRELGLSSSAVRSQAHNLTQMREAAMDTYGPCTYLDNTSGDVSALAWSPNGSTFATGSVALSDESSMQYNKPRNLLLGDLSGSIRELPEHHLARPRVHTGINSLYSMQQSQDPRLFTTVQMVSFSSDGSRLYSSSIDGKLNVYDTSTPGVSNARYMYSAAHGAPVDLLTVGNHGLVATGCRNQGRDTVRIFRCDDQEIVQQRMLGALKAQEGQSVFPSALKWGVAPHQTNFLLAGFTQDKVAVFEEDDPLDTLGEVCLYDGTTGQPVRVQNVPRNVFDVAWNPNFGQTAFAVASVVFGRVNAGMRSVVRLFSEKQSGVLKSVMELECPARDINDVVYCPYDENLVAAGSTDGKVYLWDTRYVKQKQTPRNRLTHGSCLSILPHDRQRWEVDTGIRFISWGESHTRLYTGSSDGVVKVWNPYLADGINHVKDIAAFGSAIMSGAFSPDNSNLLVGDDAGRVNLLSVGRSDKTVAQMSRMKLIQAPEPSIPVTESFSTHLLRTKQIEFQSSGALPIRQAVQGPAYQPLTTSTAAAIADPTAQIQDVLERDYAAVCQAAKNDDIRSAASDLQRTFRRQDRAQRRLRKLFKPRLSPCHLDCDFRPYLYTDDKDEIPDNQRSLGRIADELRREPPTGLKAFARGLVAKCAICGNAAGAPERDDGRAIKCEKCAFGCLRCGKEVELDVHRDLIWCENCGVEWRIGALGYAIVKDRAKPLRQAKSVEAEHAVAGAQEGAEEYAAVDEEYTDGDEDFGDKERERLIDMGFRNSG